MLGSVRSRRIGAATSVGIILGGAALVAVLIRIQRNLDDVRGEIDGDGIWWFVLAVPLSALAMLAIATPWTDVLVVFGIRRPRRDMTARFFAGEIGKYLPGGVWPLIGRGELLARVGVPRSAAYGSVGLSLACLYTAAAGLTVIAAPLQLGGPAAWMPALVVLGLLGLHPAVFGRFVSVLGRVLGEEASEIPVPSWSTEIGLVLRYVPAWMLVGTTTLCVAAGFDSADRPLRIAAAATLSWIVGFVVVPVPGGIGVREAAFAATCGLAPGVGAAVAVTVRVIFMVVDATAAVGAGSWLARRPLVSAGTDSGVRS